jgi:hypothetical protein
MEDRLTHSIYLEMCDLDPDDYIANAAKRIGSGGSVGRSTIWNNLRYNREDYRSTDSDFEILAIHEVSESFQAPPLDAGIRGHLFRRCPRPPQGSMRPGPTIGLLVCLVTPKTEEGKQALRDWADLTHISAIAAAGIEGFTMITAYENERAVTPRFAHIYEMDCDEPEAAFQRMAPETIKRRLGPPGTPEYRAWFGHPQLEINYINTFSLAKSFEL